MADEFMDVVYKLLESSWDDDAVERNKKTGVYSNPDKVRLISLLVFEMISRMLDVTDPASLHPGAQDQSFRVSSSITSPSANF